MGLKRTEAFRTDAARIAMTSGLTTARQLIRSINGRVANTWLMTSLWACRR